MRKGGEEGLKLDVQAAGNKYLNDGWERLEWGSWANQCLMTDKVGKNEH